MVTPVGEGLRESGHISSKKKAKKFAWKGLFAPSLCQAKRKNKSKMTLSDHWNRANEIENSDLEPQQKVGKLYYASNSAMFDTEGYFVYLRAAKRVKKAHGLR